MLGVVYPIAGELGSIEDPSIVTSAEIDKPILGYWD